MVRKSSESVEIERLTKVIHQLELTIESQHREITELRQKVSEANSSLGSVRESSEYDQRLLLKQVEAMKGQIEGLKADNDYWVQQYQLQLAKQEVSEAAYLKVVKVLAGRE